MGLDTLCDVTLCFRESFEDWTEAQKISSAMLENRSYENLIDFDNHLDDLRNDWTNPEINKSVLHLCWSCQFHLTNPWKPKWVYIVTVCSSWEKLLFYWEWLPEIKSFLKQLRCSEGFKSFWPCSTELFFLNLYIVKNL